MAEGLYSLATWVEPFGLLKHELESDGGPFEGGELALDLAVYALIVVLDLLTLPLSLLRVVGIGAEAGGTE